MNILEKTAAGFSSNNPILNEQIVRSKADRVANILRARAARGAGYEKTNNYVASNPNSALTKDLTGRARAFQLANANRTITKGGQTYNVLRNVDDQNSPNGLSQRYNGVTGKMRNRALSAGNIGSRLVSREDYIKNRITNNTKGGFVENAFRYAYPGDENPHLVRRDISEMAKEKMRQHKALTATGIGLAGLTGLSLVTGATDGIADMIVPDFGGKEVPTPNSYGDMVLPAAVLGGAGMLAYNNRRKLNEIRNPYS